jgi:OOP family OmpA-OmpF porin
MSNSVILSLLNLLDRQAIGSMVMRTGESEGSVSRGLETTFAVVLAGMARKADDSGAMRQIFTLVTSAYTGSPSAAIPGSVEPQGTPTLALVDMGRRLLPLLFGSSQSSITEMIELVSGLSAGAGNRLMAAAAPVVLDVLGRRVHDERLDIAGFKNLLRREGRDVESYLPTGLSAILNGAGSANAAREAVTTRPVRTTPSPSSRWVPALLGVLAVALALIWFQRRGGEYVDGVSSSKEQGSLTQRDRAAAIGLGDFVERQLPGGARLSVPENGVESKLLSFLQDPSQASATDTWFDFDRLTFDSSSAILRPESEEQVQNIASIMKAYPNLRLKIGGYTDSTGSARANMRLSENRAEAVRRELIAMEVPENRLQAEGYGDSHPVADNSTEEGRRRNRRISMKVLQK